MSNVIDRMPFPETPEDMHQMLRVEFSAKREQCFTDPGMNGYVILRFLARGGENGPITRRISQSSWDAARDRSIDNASV